MQAKTRSTWLRPFRVSVFLLAAMVAVPIALHAEPSPGDRTPQIRERDPVLRWNAVALQAVADDHSGTFGSPSQPGPGRTARALAILHAVIFDAANSIRRTHTPYFTLAPELPRGSVSLDAAVAAAAHAALVALYPSQRARFDAALRTHLAQIADNRRRTRGIELGVSVARVLLEYRADDGWDDATAHTTSQAPGRHRVDPLNDGQGYLGPTWGALRPFVIETAEQYRSAPPPALDSAEYAEAYADVKRLGGDGIDTPTRRTAEQTEIGLYWAYDGARGIGTPPRLYNQIARVIAAQMHNDVFENARLFALVNLAMADASIACWETKYHYDLWRPILGIRESDPGTGPTGAGDGNDATRGDPRWRPLGAPASNRRDGVDFTPPFPAYPSGHATFGAALFRTIERFYGTDHISFTFVSDELNGVTTDALGVVRPLAPRHFQRLSRAAAENARSRVYLGVHWQFDATAGLRMGNAIADHVFENALQPVN